MKQDRYSVGDSRSVRSPWVWRAFLMMTLLAVGIVIILAGNGKTGFAVAWGVIALGLVRHRHVALAAALPGPVVVSPAYPRGEPG